MEIRKYAGIVIKTIGLMVGGMLLAVVLLTLAFVVPVNDENMEVSYGIIDKEGWYPAVPIMERSLDTYFHSYLPGVLDDSTDAIMLSTAMEPQKENALLAAMDMRGYDYYWHGYVSVLRPLLFLFDYAEIRTLNGMLQLLLVALLFLQIYRKKGMAQALMVLTSYCLLMPLAMPFSLQYSWVFYIAVGGALFLTAGQRPTEWRGIKLYWSFMLIGMCTSFFDLLTYPLFTWGFPLIWVLMLQEDKFHAFTYVKEVVCTGLWWILGYAGLWISKWALGSLILKRNIFERAWYEVFFRLGAEEQEGFDIYQRIQVLYTNWKHYEYKVYVVILVVWLAWFAWQSIRKGISLNVKNKAYALIACSGIVWYLALANHTAGHHFFTYRIYGVSVLAILAILTEAVRNKSVVGNKYKLKMMCVWGICGIVACGLSLLAKEDINVTNGDRMYQQVSVPDGAVCEMRFTPTFPTVKKIGICAMTDSRKGVCDIKVLDGTVVLYEEEILLEKYDDTTYATIPVSWKLSGNKEYKMEISFVGANTDTFLLVSENMDTPINEYGQVYLNGENQGGQMLSGITYSYRPLSLFTLAFLSVTWCGVLFAAYVVFVKTKEGKNEIA